MTNPCFYCFIFELVFSAISYKTLLDKTKQTCRNQLKPVKAKKHHPQLAKTIYNQPKLAKTTTE